jgi:hypothetical protein
VSLFTAAQNGHLQIVHALLGRDDVLYQSGICMKVRLVFRVLQLVHLIVDRLTEVM